MYRVVVADPPWPFKDKLKLADGVKRGAEANYSVLTIDEIAALPVQKWCLDDALLALWVPGSLLEDGMRVMREWGFKQKQIYTWIKKTKSGKVQMGMGRQFRSCTEYALIGTRGSPKPQDKSQYNVDEDLALPHSAKPESLQNHLEKMYPDGPYLELFARRVRERWDCIGNGVAGKETLDIRHWTPFPN